MILKLPMQNKGAINSSKDSAATIKFDMYVNFAIINKKLKIMHVDFNLKLGTEFNEHQQDGFSIKKGIRKSFSEKFNINFKNPDKKNVPLNQEQCSWFEESIKKSGNSVLSLSKYLTGNNPGGSQKQKKNAEFIMDLPKEDFDAKPIINFLRVFCDKSTLKTKEIKVKKTTICMNEFINLITKTNAKDIWEDFISEGPFFYIDEMRHFLGIKDLKKKRNAKFRNLLISKFNRKDQLYNIFTARKMVEAAHIKPHSRCSEIEKDDYNNGILLSPDIHTLFDSGVITFDNQTGKVIYSTNTSSEPFNISKKEVQRLELDIYFLPKKLLTATRRKYLDYHKKNIYQQGI